MIDEPTARIILELPVDRPLEPGETVTFRVPLGAEREGVRAAERVEVAAQEKWKHPDDVGYFLLLEDEPGYVQLTGEMVRTLLMRAGYEPVPR